MGRGFDFAVTERGSLENRVLCGDVKVADANVDAVPVRLDASGSCAHVRLLQSDLNEPFVFCGSGILAANFGLGIRGETRSHGAPFMIRVQVRPEHITLDAAVRPFTSGHGSTIAVACCGGYPY